MMSQQQFNTILSNMLKEKQALNKLKAELEGKKKKLCHSCKEFRHLAQNCRQKGEEEKKKAISQNKFEVLSSRVMQCGVEERVACVTRPQNAQQEKKLAHSLWRKAQEHSGMQGMPLKGTALEKRGWKTKKEIVTFVECGGYEYKGTKTEENQEQGFISGKQLKNL